MTQGTWHLCCLHSESWSNTHPKLDLASRMKISSAERSRLAGVQNSWVVRRAIELAASLRDRQSIPMLMAISKAKDAPQAGLTLTDPDGFAVLRLASSSALETIRRSR